MDEAKSYRNKLDKAQESLSRIKDSVRNAHDYFQSNYERYNDFRRFVFETSLRPEDIQLLQSLGKPQLEFNVLEAYISRLLGEFSKQEPDIEVSADDQNQADPLTIKIVEQHLRHTLCDSKNHHTRYEVYKDLLSGGMSVLKVTTDYANPMSMHQVINFERVEPTLCGFDSLAKYSHKGDGRFCFELFPKTKKDFEEEFPEIDISNISFSRKFQGFNWSYINDKTEVILLVDYYEKKKKNIEIVSLKDGKVMTMKKYKEMLDRWGDLTVPPAIVNKRKTTQEVICRYRLIENQIIEYVETDFAHFPLVFVDGNSIKIKGANGGDIRQVIRPYVYHARDAQRLKNFSGIALANEIENIIQHKIKIAKEAMPKEAIFQEAYKNVQRASVLVYNQFYEGNPDQPIPNPISEVNRVPAPPEIIQGFTSTDSQIQQILGSYDASLGINDNQLSGVALVEAATQSNAAAMPYIVGYLQGFQRAAQIYVDLMPKYYTTPRTLPVMDGEGEKSYVMINQDQGFDMFYDANALNVVVKAGASFTVQKSRTVMMVKEMMGMSPLFAQFIAEKGLPFVLDNMEGKGIEELKKMVDGWLQEMQQQKQLAMQQQQQEMQNNPAMLKQKNDAMKLQLESQKAQAQFAVDMQKLQADEKKVMIDAQMSNQEHLVQVIKANTERFAKEVDLQLRAKDMHHKHLKETIETHHMVSQPQTIQ